MNFHKNSLLLNYLAEKTFHSCKRDRIQKRGFFKIEPWVVITLAFVISMAFTE